MTTAAELAAELRITRRMLDGGGADGGLALWHAVAVASQIADVLEADERRGLPGGPCTDATRAAGLGLAMDELARLQRDVGIGRGGISR
jgi:hypothetical protein